MAERPLALIVDDEEAILELLTLTLEGMGIAARCASDLEQACGLLGKERFDLCLTDMRLPGGSGIELVERLQRLSPPVPVAVITAYGDVESAVESLKAGAFDFVSKPVDLGVLRRLVKSALALSQQRSPRRTLIGHSPAMEAVRARIAKLARSQAPVFIRGASGTGKELAARLIHEQGPRAEGPFVAVNCGAVPHELMESEFFGHKRGSFTGAVGDKPGLFQSASGGTLFLDEVAELPPSLQVKLLRAIQERAVRPVGGHREVPVDVRIISASHQNLEALVEEGRFRQDLYYRLHVIELRLPALAEHKEDIPALVDHFLARLAPGRPPALSREAMEALMAYGFPGNVRELENILERAVALHEGERIEAEDLGLPSPREASPPSLPDYLDQVERRAILDALKKAGHNKTQAAALLGISFRALRYRLKKLGLEG